MGIKSKVGALALLRKNYALRTKNDDLRETIRDIRLAYTRQITYANWLEKENARLLNCMNNGARAMMEYQKNFQN